MDIRLFIKRGNPHGQVFLDNYPSHSTQRVIPPKPNRRGFLSMILLIQLRE